MTKQFQDKILQTIEEKNIEPKSHTALIIRKSVLYILIITSVILGALAVATSIFISANSNWETVRYIRNASGMNFIQNLPILWILVFILLIYAIYREVRHTEGGYRYKMTTMLGSVIIITLLSGIGLYALGTGHAVDKMSGKLPGYRPVELRQQNMWTNPGHGLLAGRVLATTTTEITLQDFSDTLWTVTYSPTHAPYITSLPTNTQIRILGIEKDNQHFTACMIMPWELKGIKPIKKDNQPPQINQKIKSERNIQVVRSKECEEQFKPQKENRPPRN